MKMSEAEITPDKMADALAAIGAWRAAPLAVVACPLCGRDGLGISDHSARPHAEWYRLVCRDCGLDQMIAVPLGAAVPGGEG